VVAIGADDTVRAILEPWKRDHTVLEYADVEAAVYGLSDNADIGQDAETGRWRCTVLYGPHSLGLALAQNQRLEHTGWTIIAAPNIDTSQHEARRVQDHRVDMPGSTLALEAAAKLAPHLMIDTMLVQDETLAQLLVRLSDRPEP
jgi:hypothetical protein